MISTCCPTHILMCMSVIRSSLRYTTTKRYYYRFPCKLLSLCYWKFLFPQIPLWTCNFMFTTIQKPNLNSWCSNYLLPNLPSKHLVSIVGSSIKCASSTSCLCQAAAEPPVPAKSSRLGNVLLANFLFNGLFQRPFTSCERLSKHPELKPIQLSMLWLLFDTSCVKFRGYDQYASCVSQLQKNWE